MPWGPARARVTVAVVVGSATLVVGGCAGSSPKPTASASATRSTSAPGTPQPGPNTPTPQTASPPGADAEQEPLPGARTVTGASSTVTGTVDEAALTAYATMADRAVAQVAKHWSPTWPRRVTIVAPADATAFRELVGRADDLSQVAAVTVGPVDPTTGLATRDRVVLNPDAFRSLTPSGRQFVITHESTHVAVRASIGGAAPLWLAEGFADHVGYAGSGRSRTELAAALLDEVDAARGPTRLPTQADFDPGQGEIAPTYLAAWLAVDLIHRRRGPAVLQRFYEASVVDGSPAAADAATDEAFVEVLGTTRAEFTRLWLSELARLASPP
ncbi:hypothetical protein N801_09400 [Knoellia aerolata DSM 18566]|uniref:Peptidase MA-like domain-containing protein n=2 Tax=Knoellia TaxID=136099 RepID=A0A0A0JWM5_9MICO|nr:hypothetical protein N801_09400 [Knoellia aerolata DSM 18566]